MTAEQSIDGGEFVMELTSLEAAREMAKFTHIVAVCSVLSGQTPPGDPANRMEWRNLPFLYDALCAAENYEAEEEEFIGRLFQEAAAILPAFFREPAQMERMALEWSEQTRLQS